MLEVKSKANNCARAEVIAQACTCTVYLSTQCVHKLVTSHCSVTDSCQWQLVHFRCILMAGMLEAQLAESSMRHGVTIIYCLCYHAAGRAYIPCNEGFLRSVYQHTYGLGRLLWALQHTCHI